MLQETECHLVDAIFGEISLQILRAVDFRVIRQRGLCIHRLLLQPSARVELLEGHSPRVNLGVTLPACGLIAMLFDALPQREPGRVLFQRRNIGRRIGWRFGDNLPRQPRAPLHRIRFPAVRQTRHDGRLREHTAQLRPSVLNGHEPEAAIGLFGQVVVAGHGFVGHHEIGLNQIPDRQVVPHQILQKLNRLLLQLGACIARELGIPLTVRFQHLELIQAQPLRRKLAGKP